MKMTSKIETQDLLNGLSGVFYTWYFGFCVPIPLNPHFSSLSFQEVWIIDTVSLDNDKHFMKRWWLEHFGQEYILGNRISNRILNKVVLLNEERKFHIKSEWIRNANSILMISINFFNLNAESTIQSLISFKQKRIIFYNSINVHNKILYYWLKIRDGQKTPQYTKELIHQQYLVNYNKTATVNSNIKLY